VAVEWRKLARLVGTAIMRPAVGTVAVGRLPAETEIGG
jgi:hypothetical protein